MLFAWREDMVRLGSVASMYTYSKVNFHTLYIYIDQVAYRLISIVSVLIRDLDILLGEWIAVEGFGGTGRRRAWCPGGFRCLVLRSVGVWLGVGKER